MTTPFDLMPVIGVASNTSGLLAPYQSAQVAQAAQNTHGQLLNQSALPTNPLPSLKNAKQVAANLYLTISKVANGYTLSVNNTSLGGSEITTWVAKDIAELQNLLAVALVQSQMSQ